MAEIKLVTVLTRDIGKYYEDGECPHCGKFIIRTSSIEKCRHCGNPIAWSLIDIRRWNDVTT